MSTATDVEVPVVYVRWEVDTSIPTSCSNVLASSEFRFQKHECRLQYYRGNWEKINKYYLDIRILRSSSFVASVHVEDCEIGRIRPQLSQMKRIIPSGFTITIWSMEEANVHRLVQIKRNYHKIKFLVILKKDDVLTDMDSKETQTECYLPEAVGPASCSTTSTSVQPIGRAISTTSTSVQTTLLHSVSPCLESLSEDLAQLMVQDSDPDMEFLCGGQSTRAHRSIVCSRSPVIARMMASDMVEGRTGVVEVPNMEPDVFKTFLGYLYSGKLEELSFDAAVTLYGVGGQYAVPTLAKRCLQYLMEHLSVENACEVLAVADVHGDSKFAENVIEYILENKIPLVSDGWSDFCDDHPKLANKILSHFYKMSMNVGEN